MSLIAFHRVLIVSAIAFGVFFAWRLWSGYQAYGDQNYLYGAIGVAVVTGAFGLYLPTVGARRSRR